MKGAFLLGLVLDILFGALGGWALMLTIGVAHHEWWPVVPTIGFWPAVGMGILLRLALFSPSTGGDS